MTKKKWNKAVDKRRLISVEQYGLNPQTKTNNFLFPLTRKPFLLTSVEQSNVLEKGPCVSPFWRTRLEVHT